MPLDGVIKIVRPADVINQKLICEFIRSIDSHNKKESTIQNIRNITQNSECSIQWVRGIDSNFRLPNVGFIRCSNIHVDVPANTENST